MTAGRPGVLRRLVRAFWPDLRRYGRLLLASYGFRTVAVAGGVLAPWPLKLLIDHVIVDPSPVTIATLRIEGQPGTLLVTLTFLFVAVSLIAALANALEKNLSATIRERLTLDLRDRVLAHLLMLSPTLRTTHRSGEIVLRIVDDTDLFVRVLTKSLPQIFQHALTLGITCVAMIWLQPGVALAGALCLLPAAMFLRRDGRRLWKASREKRSCEGNVSGFAQEIVRGMGVIQASGDESATRSAFREVNRVRLTAGRRETAVAVSLERKLQILQGLSMAVVTAAGTWLVLRKQMTVGDLTLLTAYVSQLLKPVEKLNDLAETTGRGIAGGDRLLRLLDTRPAVRDRIDAVNVERSRGILELREVWFAYANRQRSVLRGVSVRLQPGELTALVGASGAGKTTLMSLIVRLFEPTRGDILLDGRSIRSIRLAALRGQFAILSQDTHLFAGTVRKVLQPPGSGLDDPALWRALKLVSLDSFVRQSPDQLDTVLGEDGVNLSGGQRRRLALARAFLLDRPILLLDEPLANVDPESATVILDAIEELRGVRTCFAVTHDQALVDRADRVCQLVDGQLVERWQPAVPRLQAVTR
jgi:ATP-binding cassette, subfamily B, bacterial